MAAKLLPLVRLVCLSSLDTRKPENNYEMWHSTKTYGPHLESENNHIYAFYQRNTALESLS